MKYTPREKETLDPDRALFFSLEPLILGIGLSLVELNVFHSKGRGEKAGNVRPFGSYTDKKELRAASQSLGSVQVRVVVYSEGITGIDDCTKVHRLIMPRLELAFPGKDVYLEVTSPGVDRIIKDGSEFVHYIGRCVNCYRTDISDWTAGVLLSADDKKIELLGGGGEISLPYEVIAKARLNGIALPKSHGGVLE